MQFQLAVMAGVLVFVFMPMLVFFMYIVRPWTRGLLSGIRISLLLIVLMRIRRSDVNQIIDALVMALQSDVSIPVEKMERASVQQVDLEKVTLAMIESERRGLGLEFDELVEAELSSRLAEKLAE